MPDQHSQRDAQLTVEKVAKVLLWLIYVWVFVTLILLFLAFILLILGANPNAGFAQWVYRSVERAMAPFRGLFEPIKLSDDSVLDTSLLFAMIVYGIVALLLRSAIDWITDRIVQRQRRLADTPDAIPTNATTRPSSAPPEVR